MVNEEHLAVVRAYANGDREAINRWRAEHPDELLNLNKANLHGMNLSETDLSLADLREADLSEANLYGTDLGDADLRSADLGDADLSSADLTDTFLLGADLRRANFQDSKGTPIASRQQMEYIAAQRTAYLLYCAKD